MVLLLVPKKEKGKHQDCIFLSFVYFQTDSLLMLNEQLQIAALKQDDPKVVREIYLANKKTFFSFANRYQITTADLQDIYQDAVIALIENAKRGKLDTLKSSVSTYLIAIGKFMIFKKLKQESAKIEFSVLENLDIEDFEATDETLEQTKRMKQQFVNLGPKCQELLRLFYYEEQNLDAIMGIVGASSKDVLKSQKARCVKQLKDLVNLTIPNHG